MQEAHPELSGGVQVRLEICQLRPVLVVPSAVIGVTLYFMKALHVVYPAVVIPALLFIPLAIFYVVFSAMGVDWELARNPTDNCMPLFSRRSIYFKAVAKPSGFS